MIAPLLLSLAIIIVAAKLGGWLSGHLGQPAVLGELIIGLILGPSVLNIFGQAYFETAHVTGTLIEMGELGVIFLMFVAGLEIDLRDLLKTGRASALSGSLGVVIPIIMGLVVAVWFGYAIEAALFIGIIMGATSVSISAQTLMELGLIRSREGLTLLGAAVVDDVLAIIALSVFIVIVGGDGGSLWLLVWTIARMLLFLSGAFLLGIWLLPRLSKWAKQLPIGEPVMSVIIATVLLYAWASEALGGVAVITGAFIAGVGLARSPVKEEIEYKMRTLAYALFVPIFLVGIGLTANVRTLSGSDLGFALVISLTAIVSKIIGAGAGAKFGGMTGRESLRVGAGMVSRGEVGLIIAEVGVLNGLINSEVFTIEVVMVLATTLVAPPLLRLVFRDKKSRKTLT
ncbi:MAG: cation:proton antiporter [Anaerolineae bacterium]|nr:cation:proton antiporter [Anaerolineae bacterium]